MEDNDKYLAELKTQYAKANRTDILRGIAGTVTNVLLNAQPEIDLPANYIADLIRIRESTLALLNPPKVETSGPKLEVVPKVGD